MEYVCASIYIYIYKYYSVYIYIYTCIRCIVQMRWNCNRDVIGLGQAMYGCCGYPSKKGNPDDGPL